MSFRSILFIVILLVWAFLSESAPPRRSLPQEVYPESSGELPPDDRNPFEEEEENLGNKPPSSDRPFEDDFGMAVIKTAPQPSDYDYRNPEDEDATEFEPEEKVEILPDDDERPFEEPRDDDIDEAKDEDLDKPQDGEEESFADKDFKVPVDDDDGEPDEKDSAESDNDDQNENKEEVPASELDEDEDDDNDGPPKYDENDESGEVPKDDEEDEDSAKKDFFHGGLFFDAPFFNMRQVSKYFHQLEKALEHVFRQTMEEVILLNGTYANTTEEEVEINGKKYVIQKSIIQGKDNNSSIYIEALSSSPKTNKTKVLIDNKL